MFGKVGDLADPVDRVQTKPHQLVGPVARPVDLEMNLIKSRSRWFAHSIPWSAKLK